MKDHKAAGNPLAESHPYLEMARRYPLWSSGPLLLVSHVVRLGCFPAQKEKKKFFWEKVLVYRASAVDKRIPVPQWYAENAKTQASQASHNGISLGPLITWSFLAWPYNGVDKLAASLRGCIELFCPAPCWIPRFQLHTLPCRGFKLLSL